MGSLSISNQSPIAASQQSFRSESTSQTSSRRRQSIRSASPDSHPIPMQQEARERLAASQPNAATKILKYAGAALAGTAVVAGTVVGTIGLATAYLPARGIAAIRDKFSKSLVQSQENARELRGNLGKDFDKGVVNKIVFVKGAREGEKIKTTVGDLMETYRSQLGSKITEGEMHAYINMGQRIVDAIGNNKEDKTVIVDVDGKKYEVKSNLETTRAISWYLQAKAVMDNAADNHDSPDIREPVFLNRGSMLMKDPDSKLFNFLNSSPNAYGRASTHFNERSASAVANLRNTGAAGMLAGLTGNQAAQRGIEDFGNKMPSGQGCLLFDKLNTVSNDGAAGLFMKWESVGTPTVFGSGTHADKESGWSGKVGGRFGSMSRCLGHTFNFIASRFESGGKDWGIRREAVKKGETREVLKTFNDALPNISSRLGRSDQWVSERLGHAKTFGMVSMKATLQEVSEELSAKIEDLKKSKGKGRGSLDDQWGLDMSVIKNAMEKLDDTYSRLGNDLGVWRRGDEVHVQPYMD